jgi:hypothetical protein
MPVTLSRRALVGMALAAASLALLTIFLLQAEDEDRNPIRVKNNKLRIETEDKDAKWKKPGAAEKWRLDGGNRTTTDRYWATAYGAVPGCVAPLQGTSVEIKFQVTSGSLQTYTFSLQMAGNKNEPVLDTDAPLTDDNSKKVKKLMPKDDPEGVITQMTVRDGSTEIGKCDFPGDRRVQIEICMHGC